jgi:ketosteroid isomerase-like protein
MNEDVARLYFRCLDEEDWTTMRTLWHEDAELRAVGARPRHGVDEVIGYFSKLFDPWAEHRDAPTRLCVAQDTITAEVTFTGTTLDGRTVTLDAVDVFDFEDGRIRSMSNWYDIAYARRALAAETSR